MSVRATNDIAFSEVCAELYGNPSTNGRTLLTAHADALPEGFDNTYAVAGNTLMDFRNYNHNVISTTGVNWIIGGSVKSGYSYNIATSSNGSVWTYGSISGFTSIHRVKHLNGLWVILGDGTYNFATSSDGVNWTKATIPIAPTDVTYGSGKYVICSASGAQKFAYSSNGGVNWSTDSSANIFDFIPQAIEFGNGKFICTGDASGSNTRILTTSVGYGWSNSTLMNLIATGMGIKFNGSNWLIGGHKFTTGYYPMAIGNVDGTSWTGVNPTGSGANTSGSVYYKFIEWLNGKWIVGIEDTSGAPEIITSSDGGTTWSSGGTYSSTATGIASAANKVELIFNTGELVGNPDGVNWEIISDINQINPADIGVRPYNPDATTPTFTTDLYISGQTETSVSLAWASTDNVGVTKQILWWRNTNGAWAQIALTASATSYNKTGLTTGQTYEFYVRAEDAEGNYTNSYNPSVTLNDTTKPSTPTGFQMTTYNSSSVSLSWNASTDNVAVDHYRVKYRAGTSGTFSYTTATGLTKTVSGLSAGTYYQFYVQAVDAAGNYSNDSGLVGQTTAPSVTYTTIDGDLQGYGYATNTDAKNNLDQNHTGVYYTGASLEVGSVLYTNSQATTPLDGRSSGGANGWWKYGTTYVLLVNSSGNVLEKQNINDTLSISPTSKSIGATSTTPYTITVTSNTGWNVSESASWLSVSPTTGVGNGSVTVTPTSNGGTNTSERSANITFKSGSGYKTLTHVATQAGTAATLYQLSLGYNSSSETNACGAFKSTYYGDASLFANCTVLYTDSGGTSIAPIGYYSDGFIVRQMVRGKLGLANQCGGGGPA